MTLSNAINGKQNGFIPHSIFPAYRDVPEMVAFVESCGDTVTKIEHDIKGCSHLITTAGGFRLAYNGHLSRIA